MKNISTALNMPESLMWHMPGYIAWKDTDSIFLGCNKKMANLVGFKTIDEFVGKTDFDLPCEASQYAENFIFQDKKVMINESSKSLDIIKYADGNLYCILSEKEITKNTSGKVTGTVCHLTHIENIFLRAFSKVILNLDNNLSAKHLLGSYQIGGSNKNYHLTIREQEVLFHLVRNRSSKEIGVRLNISSRTVEVHTENLKSKFNVLSKAALITSAIEEGFFYMLPENLFSPNRQNANK